MSCRTSNCTRDFEMESKARLRFTKEKVNWWMLDIKAHRYIVMSLDEKSVSYIINCKTRKVMWNKLFSVYEQKSDNSKKM